MYRQISTRACALCGNDFPVTTNQTDKRFCSRTCYFADVRLRTQTTVRNCPSCGSDFVVTAHNGDKQFCSHPCYAIALTLRFRPLAERFWEKVHKTPTCWLWTGAKNDTGYGCFHTKNGRLLAHRIAWELTNGAIPDGLVLCHSCDTPACCNPSHLFLGTMADNTHDSMSKDRHSRGERNGHAKLTDDAVRHIRAARILGSPSQQTLAETYGVNRSLISMVATGRIWQHVT